MQQSEFWIRLEYRITAEFAGMVDRQLQYWWCDGIMPSWFRLEEPTPKIEGITWICNGPLQDEWRFAIFLPQRVASRDDIDWASLLPPQNVTRWMAFDAHRKYLEIEPATAVTDHEI